MAPTPRFHFPPRVMSRPAWLTLLTLAPAVGGAIVVAGDVAAQSAPLQDARGRPALPVLPVSLAGPVSPIGALNPASPASTANRSSAAHPPGLASPAMAEPTRLAAAAPAGAVPSIGAAGAAGGAAGASRAHRGAVGCLIGPERTADIGSAVTGVVARIDVDRGDAVRQGQVLLALEQTVERNSVQVAQARSGLDADVRSAEAQLELARDRHRRMAALQDSGAVAQVAIEQARAEAEVAEQRLEQARGQRRVQAQELAVAQAQLAQRTLRAPFAGVVVERMAHEGERVEDRPLLRLAQLDPLRVELVMPAQRWNSVKPGDMLPVLPELPGAARALARVTHVDRMLDAASNTFRVRLALANPGHRLPAGARCKLDVPADTPGAAPGVPPAASPGASPEKAAPAPATPEAAAPAAPGSAMAIPTPGGAALRPAVYGQQTHRATAAGTPRLRFTI